MGIHITTEQKKPRKGMYFTCLTCGKEFYVYPSYLRKCEKNGSYPKYCSMACYDKTGDNNPFWGKQHREESIDKMSAHPNRSKFKPGKENPNFVRFGEDSGFEPVEKITHKEKLMRETGGCQRCDVTDDRILTIHHIDRDKTNNSRENLEVLCWNCHVLEHYEHQDGMYTYLKNRTTGSINDDIEVD